MQGMECAAILYFDPQTESRIEALWDDLLARNIPCVFREIGSRPHVTLAVFPECPPDSLRDPLADFAASTPPLPVTLGSVGVFSARERQGKGVVYLGPIPTFDLLAFHERFHQLLGRLDVPSVNYYLPGNWVPHGTVSIDLRPELIGPAVELCRVSDALNHRGRFVEIALVEFQPGRELCSFPLAG